MIVSLFGAKKSPLFQLPLILSSHYALSYISAESLLFSYCRRRTVRCSIPNTVSASFGLSRAHLDVV